MSRRRASRAKALEDAVRRTTLWAARQRAAERAPGQLVFGMTQGHTDDELRRRSIAELAELDFDGYALGGLAIGEDRDQMLETTAWSAPLLPGEKPRYFMGIGDPVGILDVVERGIDMFDCVWPTRLGADRHRAHVGGQAQPEERALHVATAARSTSAADAPRASASRAPTCAISSTRTSCSGSGCSACIICASCST